MLRRLPFRVRLPAGTLLWCGLIAMMTGVSIMAFGRPGPVPAATSLTEVSGRIAAVSVHDLSGAPTDGTFFPGMTEVRIRFEGVPGVFVYPAGHPVFFVVRDHLGGDATLLIDRADFDDERMVWGLEASGRSGEPIVVTHDEIATTLARVDRSAARMGGGFAVAGLLLAVAGRAAGALNDRLPGPSERTRERWLERRERLGARVLGVAGAIEGLFGHGARAFAWALGPALGAALWGLLWCLVYAGAALGLGIAIYGG